MCRYIQAFGAIGLSAGLLFGWAGLSRAGQSGTIAIDVALDPDATMMQRAHAANARLLSVYPAGFALDETHSAHVTILQRYVRAAALDEVNAAVEKILSGVNPSAWRLEATKYYYTPSDGIGLAGIVVEPTADLLGLQQKLIDALAPFTKKTGTAAAFYTTPDNPNIIQPLIDYVATFVPMATGKNYNPHVTVGIASLDYLKGMVAESFDAFTFYPVGASVYQLGNYGTARKELATWAFKPGEP